jgi:NDP-sugar pyrophosphorylase family protein
MNSWISIPILLSTLLISNQSMADVVYPCSGQAGTYRTNPDASLGGFVSARAVVDETIFVTPEASICDTATVLEGAVISDRATVGGRATVKGNVLISGKAKVYGEANILNTNGEQLLVMDEAQIYGYAYLKGSVLVAGTSEVYGWAKVLKFAQVMGDSRLCGRAIANDFDVLIDDQTKCAQ